MLLFGQILLVQNLVNNWQKGYIYIQYFSYLSIYNCWCNASILWYDTSRDYHASVRVKVYFVGLDWHILLSDQILLVQNLVNDWQKGYVYIQYFSYLSIYNCWCNAYILWYDTSRDYHASVRVKVYLCDLIDTCYYLVKFC